MTCSRVVLRSAGNALSRCLSLVFLRPSYSQQRAWLDGRIEFGDDSGEWAKDGECDDPRFEGEGLRTRWSAQTCTATPRTAKRSWVRGESDSERTLRSARRRRSRRALAASSGPSREGRRDAQVGGICGRIRVRRRARRTRGRRSALRRVRPLLCSCARRAAQQFDNDDYEGDSTHSRLAIDLEETGTYLVTVTSYAKRETGGYTVAIDARLGQATIARIDRDGSLQAGDEMLKSGEFFDAYDFEASPGQHVSIDVMSQDVDTYLILKSARRRAGRERRRGRRRHRTQQHRDGPHRDRHLSRARDFVRARGEIGDYHLTIAPSAGDRDRAPRRNVRTLTAGHPSNGLPSGGYQHRAIDRGSIGPFDLLLAR